MASEITVTRYLDHSVEVEDFGRGIPVDYNNKEQRYNWELVFCEMYAGGKYNNDSGEQLRVLPGLKRPGPVRHPVRLASTWTWTSAGMAAATPSTLRRGRTSAACKRSRLRQKGHRLPSSRWKPDLQVFTDIDVPVEYYLDILKRQAVVNAGITFRLRNEVAAGKFETTDFCYENGIVDHVKELAGRGRPDRRCSSGRPSGRAGTGRTWPEYKVKINVACCLFQHVST